MYVLLYNSVAFMAAAAIWLGGLIGITALAHLLELEVGPRALLLFSAAFGLLGHFLFRGNSRVALVFVAWTACAMAHELYAPLPGQTLVKTAVWLGFGIVAALTTWLAGWIAGLADRVRGKARSAVEGISSHARRRVPLAYRVGKWVGDRRRKPDDSK